MREEADRSRRVVTLMAMVLFCCGYSSAIGALAAPWIQKSFAFDEAGLANLFAWLAFSRVGAFALSRASDVAGRRRVLLWCEVGSTIFAILSAVATSVYVFAVCAVFFNAFVTGTIACATVLIAEETNETRRAGGQAYGGLALSVGAGVTAVLMPVLAHYGYSWRWLLVFSALLGTLRTPITVLLVPESRHWQQKSLTKQSRGMIEQIFSTPYRRRAVMLMVYYLVSAIGSTGPQVWLYFHAVSIAKLPLLAATEMMLTVGVISLVGFPLGAWTAEKFGRVTTLTVSNAFYVGGTLAFFLGPPARSEHAGLWLASAFFCFVTSAHANNVAARATATELFPTGLRAAAVGWMGLMAAIGGILAQAAVARFGPAMGGVSNVVAALTILIIPVTILYGVEIQETKGLSLSVAAKEDG